MLFNSAIFIAGFLSLVLIGSLFLAGGGRQRLAVRFRTAELESLHNVGQFAQLILAKSAGA